MNVEQTRQVLEVLRVEYGNKVMIDENRIAIWHGILSHADFSEVQRAVIKLLAKGGQFPPSVGEVNQAVLEARRDTETDAGVVWDRVLAAAQRSAYYAAEEAAKLPPTALEAIGGIAGLKELALAQSDKIAIIRAQFRQRYEVLIKKSGEDATAEALLTLLPQIKQLN
jgi:hypothetical protein